MKPQNKFTHNCNLMICTMVERDSKLMSNDLIDRNVSNKVQWRMAGTEWNNLWDMVAGTMEHTYAQYVLDAIQEDENE